MDDELLVLLVAIAGETVAIPARDVGSVIEIGEIVPVPRAASHVRGLYALRSRVLTVIDARAAVGGGGQAPVRAETAVVLEIDGHGYALIVDAVLDVVTATARTAAVAVLGAQWARIAGGQVMVAGDAMLLVSPAALIETPERAAA